MKNVYDFNPRQRQIFALSRMDACVVVFAADEFVRAHLGGDPECPDYLRALIEVLREVGLADS